LILHENRVRRVKEENNIRLFISFGLGRSFIEDGKHLNTHSKQSHDYFAVVITLRGVGSGTAIGGRFS